MSFLTRSNVLCALFNEAPENILGSEVWFIFGPDGDYLDGVFGSYPEACSYASGLDGFMTHETFGSVTHAAIKNIRGTEFFSREQVHDMRQIKGIIKLVRFAEIAADLGYRYFSDCQGKVYRIVDPQVLSVQYTNVNMNEL